MAPPSERLRFRRALASALLVSTAGCALLIGEPDAYEFQASAADSGPGSADAAKDGGADIGDSGTDVVGDAKSDTSSADAGCVALHFAVPGDGVSIADSPALGFGLTGTMEAWFYAEPIQSKSVAPNIFNKVTPNTEDKRLWIGPDLSPIGFLFPSVDLVGNKPVPTETWVHIALSWSNAGQALFVNGAVAATAAAPTPANGNGSAHIGSVVRDNNTTVPPVYGFISEMRISNVARYTLPFTPAPHLVVDASTTAFYRLDEGSGLTAHDGTQSAHDGTIAGAKWAPAPCR